MVDPPEMSTLDGSSQRLAMDPIATSPISTGVTDLDLTISTPTGSTEIVSYRSDSSETPARESVTKTSIGQEDVNEHIRQRGSSNSDLENDPAQAEWVPPQDLTSFMLSRTSFCDPVSPSSSVGPLVPSMPSMGATLIKSAPPPSKATASGVASPNTTQLMKSGYSTTSLTITPLAIHHPQATGSGASNSNRSASEGTAPSSTLKTTHMARKAQRYSSMKKRNGNKQGSSTTHSLLNRLFCNTPLSNNCSMDDDAPAVSTLSVHSGSSAEENTSPHSHNNGIKDGQAQYGPTTCFSVGAECLEQASESLTLHSEAKVRRSIQTTLQDSLMACGGGTSTPSGGSTSPPSFPCTVNGTTCIPRIASDESVASGPQPVNLVGDAAVGSIPASSRKKFERPSPRQASLSIVHDEDNDIEAPDTKLSIFLSDDDDIAETASQPHHENRANPDGGVPQIITHDSIRSPRIKKLNSRQIKTAGGLVIPPQFTHSGKGVFPTAQESYYAKASMIQKSPPKDRRSGERSPRRKSHSPRKPRKLNSSPAASNGTSYIDTGLISATKSPLHHVITTESKYSVDLPQTSSDQLVLELDETLASPLVTELNANKAEVSEDAQALQPGEVTLRGVNATYFSSVDSTDNESSVRQDGEKAMGAVQVSAEQAPPAEQEIDPVFPVAASASSSDLVDPNETDSKGSSDLTLEDLKAKYKRKISEQKDQAILANRVARMRLEEIGRLEAEMAALRGKQVDEDELLRLKDRLQQTRNEKKKEVERVRKQMESRLEDQKKQLHEYAKAFAAYRNQEQELLEIKKKLHASIAESEELNKVKAELAAVKSKLKDTEIESQSRSSNSPSKASTEMHRLKLELSQVQEEAAQLRKELETSKTVAETIDTGSLRGDALATDCEFRRIEDDLIAAKETLASKESASESLEAELILVRESLAKVTEALESKENELLALKASASPSVSVRHKSPRAPPKRSNDETRRQGVNDSPSRLDDLSEVYEREKESLRQQIALLEAQATESNREHERALSELRAASEQEIASLRKEMESRLERHLEKERALKKTLTAVNSREKGELLDHIERLQAEKKNDRTGGLREVQKKEELIERISILEKKEKSLIEEHERAIQDLRMQGEHEIEKLRNEMKKQEEIRLSRERELHQAISETSSFEKEELRHRIEKLEGLLESERKGAVLVMLKLSNMEKDVDRMKIEHHRAIEVIETSKTAEIERLKAELDERSALEVAMQIATNERDEMKKEVQRCTAALEQCEVGHATRLEELRTLHANEIAVISKDSATEIENLERTNKARVLEGERKADERCEEISKSFEEKMSALRKEHSQEVEKLKREVKAVEETYKVLVTESNNQYETFQKESDANIKELELELKEKEEQFKTDLETLEQSIQDAKNLRLEYDALRSKQETHDLEMKEAEERHNKQFEDLLNQLDLVEAEHQQTTAMKEKAILEKEAIVDALGSQLAEAQRKIAEAQSERQNESEKAVHAERKCQSLIEEVQLLSDEIQSLKESHKKFSKEAAIAREKACEDAREEMIEKAEIQFQQANEHYVKLRKQYDESQERAKKLDMELKAMKKRFERVSIEKESYEIDLKAEVAKLHASNAKVEAESAQKAKEYRRELERLLTTAKEFEAKADEAEKTSRSIQTTLATVVAEKEKLQREYEEMKSVSEELMAIVEGQERHEC